jgi:hypothetical protein
VLVCAVLAVQSYPYERVYRALPKLREARLLDPDHVTSLELGPLTVALFNAGYDRGMLTSRFAERLCALMRAIKDGELDALPGHVASNEETAGCALMIKVPGVGPVVARTAWKLLTSSGADGPQ